MSYDQTSFTSDTGASFWYWTIAGAYLVEGTRNDVNTFLDIAVFDVPTRKLIIRAPGTSQVDATATAVGAGEELRRNRARGFRLAVADMTANLEAELDAFEARVEAGEDTGVTVVREDGQAGGRGPRRPDADRPVARAC